MAPSGRPEKVRAALRALAREWPLSILASTLPSHPIHPDSSPPPLPPPHLLRRESNLELLPFGHIASHHFPLRLSTSFRVQDGKRLLVFERAAYLSPCPICCDSRLCVGDTSTAPRASFASYLSPYRTRRRLLQRPTPNANATPNEQRLVKDATCFHLIVPGVLAPSRVSTLSILSRNTIDQLRLYHAI